ncbi:EAL domain-containing protein [Pseudonocardiaceae bacterium YIM PH 21723]|nr:EAL domain-containing protein [Pseudonocardiaceae bacterium YIM PH 21723]
MNASLPDFIKSGSTSTSSANHVKARQLLARKWAYLLSGTAYIPLAPPEIKSCLIDLVDRLYTALSDEQVNLELAGTVGAALVELKCTGPTSLQVTLEVLGKSLPRQAELRGEDGLADRITTLMAGLAAGYTEAIRRDVMDQQENLSRAALAATTDLQRNLAVSEARFEQIFTCSASGFAIIDLDGRVARANPALGRILDRAAGGMTPQTFIELVHPAEATAITDAYRTLYDGLNDRIKLRTRLLRTGGEPVTVSLAMSLLRDSVGNPSHYVAIIDDDTELALLGGQLHQQLLYDVVTGLPNRQFFTTQLETVLRQGDPAEELTLYHLDLDDFPVIADGLGRQVGDRLLKSIGERLTERFARERAMIARLGTDELAILVEHQRTSPTVPATIDMINQELAEPIYIGGHGVAASASIGVVHNPSRDMSPDDLLTAADLTLRRAQSGGRRQWQVYHPQQAGRDQEQMALAAVMPGAWESGEMQLTFRPVISLTDGRIGALEALLRWNHSELGALSHEDCVRLASMTGLMMPMGYWLLRSAVEQMCWWQRRKDVQLPTTIGLTWDQAMDPDLVAIVLQVAGDMGLRPELLNLGFPASTLHDVDGQAMDNITVLAENGFGTVVNDYGNAWADLAFLESMPASAVRVSQRLTRRGTQPGGHSHLTERVLRELVTVSHLAGGTVIVDGLDSPQQLAWWRRAGADAGLGTVFAPRPRTLTELDAPGGIAAWSALGAEVSS